METRNWKSLIESVQYLNEQPAPPAPPIPGGPPGSGAPDYPGDGYWTSDGDGNPMFIWNNDWYYIGTPPDGAWANMGGGGEEGGDGDGPGFDPRYAGRFASGKDGTFGGYGVPGV